MTVVCWDGKLLAADGRMTVGSKLITDSTRKLHQFTHPMHGVVTFGAAGCLTMFGPWLQTLSKEGFGFPVELDAAKDEDLHTEGVFVTATGSALLADITGMFVQVTYPIAIGSGFAIAQHYLNEGMKAPDAVRQAIKTDIHCGGQIMVWDWTRRRFIFPKT